MYVTSRDGTRIVYEQQGEGPPLILVDGALMTKSSESKPHLVGLLAPHFTVINYDRRGRGESGDTQPYGVEREIEDIEALVADAGGTAYLHGQSSGACLALHAGRLLGKKIAKVTAYEAPWNDDPAAQKAWEDYRSGLGGSLEAGRRGDALALFMHYVGAPREQIAGLRQTPAWSGFEALAPTLAYDAEVIGRSIAVPVVSVAAVIVPVLALCGGASPPFMCATARSIARSVPSGESLTLEGQTHAVQPAALAPVLIEFFGIRDKGTRAA